MIILDSSVWISVSNEYDVHKEKGFKIINEIAYKDLILPDYIYIEVLNLLKRRVSMEAAEYFASLLDRMHVNISASKLEEVRAANLFFFQNNKLSFTDCMILASAKLRNAEIATFDKELEKAWNKVKK